MSLFLKEIRKQENLTQKQLADLLGVTRSAIAQIESGKNKISKKIAERIEELYDISDKNVIENNEDVLFQEIGEKYNTFDTYQSTIMAVDAIIHSIGETKISIKEYAKENDFKPKYTHFKFWLKYTDAKNIVAEYKSDNIKITNSTFSKKLFKALQACESGIFRDLSILVSIKYRSIDKYFDSSENMSKDIFDFD